MSPSSWDTWNVKSDRAETNRKTVLQKRARVIRTRLPTGEVLTLVPVRAILVAIVIHTVRDSDLPYRQSAR